MRGDELVRVQVPADVADELLAAGVARRGEPGEFRGVGDVLEVVVSAAGAASTVISLMQGPETWKSFTAAIRSRFARHGGPAATGPGADIEHGATTVDIRAPHGSMSITLTSEVEAERIGSVVEEFLAAHDD